MPKEKEKKEEKVRPKNNKHSLKEDKFWHLRTKQEVFQELQTSDQGLSESEASIRLKKYGPNAIAQEKSFKWTKVLLEKINSILIYVLFGAALISLFTDQVIEFVVIMIIIFLTISLGFIQEYKADQTIKALNKLTAKKVTVLRNNSKKCIPAEELVPGDIVLLKRGDIIPADLRLIKVSGMQANEAILTGESNAKKKISENLTGENLVLADFDNIAFSSTLVTNGSGVGVVISTGLDTEIGKISSSLSKIQAVKSPIQKKIDGMSKKISYIVIVIAIALFILLMFQGTGLYGSIFLMCILAVSGIPESFPLALTLTLSHGIKKMADKKAIIKDLNSVETLGTTTVICTDKTGTLTENKMRVTKLYLSSENVIDIIGEGYDPNNKFKKDGAEIKSSYLKEYGQLFNTCILCSESTVEIKDNVWVPFGEPTEAAIMTLAKSANFDEALIKEQNPLVFSVPFDPSRKYMITVHSNQNKKSHLSAYLKGAGEKVLPMCKFYRDKYNKISPLTDARKEKIIKKMEEFNSEGLRVLFLASKEFNMHLNEKDPKKDKKIQEEIKNGFIFEGFTGIKDPIRKEVYSAVKECMSAGIRIIMITGDHKIIAQHIGQELGIITEDKKILVGHEVDKLTDTELDNIINDVAIFSRATPEQKLRIVSSLQRKGEIVAMTGDGVNDAPALKKADIGIGMGLNGTEVAREASNMVLTDDNFATIVSAVKEGRGVYSNIRRFVYYLLAGNFTEVSIIVFAVVFGIPLPLTALMILFVNIVTSTIPALALSIEPTSDKVMKQKPRKPKEKILSKYIMTKILTLVPFILFGTLALFMWELYIVGETLEKSMTMAFVALIVFELFHAFNARKLHTTIFNREFFNKPHMFIAIGMSVILTIAVVHLEIAHVIFGTVPLNTGNWITVILVSSSVVIFSEIIKLVTKAEFEEQKSLQGVHLHLR